MYRSINIRVNGLITRSWGLRAMSGRTPITLLRKENIKQPSTAPIDG